MSFLDAPRFGTGIGLHRVSFLLDELGIDRQWLARTAIAVTGSNGKGSTAAMCSAIAQGSGFRTGLFTSPHLYRFEERIQLNGSDVSSDELSRTSERIRAAARRYTELLPDQTFGSFELLFACAADIFFRSGCEVCVYEAGIGGRYDPVRTVGASIAAVTSLDLEHTALLGESLELICYDKTDICRRGGLVIFGESCLALSAPIRTYCALNDLRPIQLGSDIVITRCETTSSRTELTLDVPGAPSLSMSTPLVGRHQANNCAIAFLLFREWMTLQHPGKLSSQSWEQAQSAVDSVRWPGRLETIRTAPLTIIDVGHTPEGIRASLDALQQSHRGKSFVLVTGVSVDKEAGAIIEILAPHFAHIVCTRAFHKGRPVAEIAALAARLRHSATISEAANIVDAVPIATAIAEQEQCGIYVAGGLYAAIEFAQAMNGADPRALPHL